MSKKQKIIIGITGTLGAGKGTLVEYLKKKEFKHLSVRQYLIEEIKKRNMPVNRDSMVVVANSLREKNSPSYIVEQLYKIAEKEDESYIIESLRALGEIKALKNKGNFYLIAVDAEPKIRYERIIKRKSETDKISFEEFIENEQREMVSTDPNKQNLSKCIEMADFKIDNSGTFEDLHQQIDLILDKISASRTFRVKSAFSSA